MRTGSCKSVWAKDWIASGKVAEKSRFCRRFGSKASTRASSSANPRSSIRSASSSTSAATWPRCSAFLSTRSSSRPGVAITKSAPPRSAIIWGLIETPPIALTTLMRSGRCTEQRSTVSATCAASSRVGTKISVWTRRGFSRRTASQRCSSGSTNAIVLPDPVCAVASTSPPFSTTGMAAACTGVGVM